MRKIGLIFLNFDSKITKKIVKGMKEVLLPQEYQISVFEAIEEENLETVERCVAETEIPILVIDSSKDTDRFLTEAVIRLFEIMNNPLFMISNFEDVNVDVLPYLYNTVGDILLETAIVKDLTEVKYETIFFSPEREVAFTSIVKSDATNADDLKTLLENY